MQCRIGCGACCIAPSISTPIPGMPFGKPANTRCVQLSADNRCLLFDDPRRPAVCRNLKPSPDMCGTNNSEALALLEELEQATIPNSETIPVEEQPGRFRSQQQVGAPRCGLID